MLDAVANQDPEKPLYKKYFMHGTAHHMGLDVHDVGLYSRPLEARYGTYLRTWYLYSRRRDWVPIRKRLL